MVLDSGPPLLKDLMRFKPGSMTPNAWAVKAGVSRTVWTDMRRHGNPSRRTLEKLLTAAGSSLAEFEALRIGGDLTAPSRAHDTTGVSDTHAPSWRLAPRPPIPIVKTSSAVQRKPASGIEQIIIDPSTIVGHVDRPLSLADDPSAFAVTMVGNSMWPRFRPGRHLIVSPRAKVEIGDDVVVTLLREDRDDPPHLMLAMIKEITRRTAKFLELRQFSPVHSFRVEATRIANVQKIIGEVF